MRVAMIGTGYVGLVSGACFADFGHVVTCIDKDPSKIERLEKGEIPIFEPGLDDLVARNVREGRLFFTLEGADAIRNADAVFIAVGTPTRRGDGHADLSYVYAAAEEIAGLIDGFTVIVTKSTVPVGTGDEVEAIIKRVRPDAQFAVVSNPEFLREGAAIEDFKRPDRVVVGTEDERAQAVMRELYRPLNLNETREMVLFRIKQANYCSNARLFQDDAIEMIHKISQGYPRKITMLCHRALKQLVMKRKWSVDEEAIEEIVSEDMRAGWLNPTHH